jgi:hypothetical protein
MGTDVAIAFSASACFTAACFTAACFKDRGTLLPSSLVGRPLPEAREIILWLTRETKG